MATGPNKVTATTELFKDGNKVIVDEPSKQIWLDKGYAPEGKKSSSAPEKKPSKKKESNKKENKKKETKKDIEEEEIDIDNLDEQELQNFIDDEELDIDLDDYKTIKQKRDAVFEAANED